MRDHRLAVGVSLEGKIREHGFFLNQIIAISRTIEQKHIRQDYPINLEVDRLNYFFSAYLNTIQSLKDASQTATGSPHALTLCCELSREILASLRVFLTREGGNIPTPDTDDFKRSLAASLESSFVPDYVKEMTRANRTQIEASMAGATIDVVKRALDAITAAESDLAILGA